MNQKLLDYEKVLSVIRSCRTNAQNQVAYKMVWNFQDKYKSDSYTLELFTVCDLNLQQICGGYGDYQMREYTEYTVNDPDELDVFDDYEAYLETDGHFFVRQLSTNEMFFPRWCIRENGDIDGFEGWSDTPDERLS